MSRSFRSFPVLKFHRHHNKESVFGTVRTKSRNRFAKALREGRLEDYVQATILEAGLDFDDPIIKSPRRREMFIGGLGDMIALCRK